MVIKLIDIGKFNPYKENIGMYYTLIGRKVSSKERISESRFCTVNKSSFKALSTYLPM